MRLASAIALGKLGDESGRLVLEDAFTKGDEDARVRVISGLAHIDAQWAIDLLKQAKED